VLASQRCPAITSAICGAAVVCGVPRSAETCTFADAYDQSRVGAREPCGQRTAAASALADKRARSDASFCEIANLILRHLRKIVAKKFSERQRRRSFLSDPVCHVLEPRLALTGRVEFFDNLETC
jgi:hypothetical protein